ncbi:hypothetical protein [Viscerimonas tarda]
MKILVIILGNLLILSLGVFLRYLHKRYFLKEKGITFRKLFNGKPSKSKEYDLENFENEISNRTFGCLFIIIVAITLWFLSSKIGF